MMDDWVRCPGVRRYNLELERRNSEEGGSAIIGNILQGNTGMISSTNKK